MSTVQEIMDGGLAKCAAARPGTFAPAELIAEVGMALRAVFQVMARENPYIIGERVQVTWNGTGWSRPSNALRVIKVLADAGTLATPALAVGAEIGVVPYDDQRVAAGRACITELGQAFYPTGQSMDPSGGTITVVCATAPTPPTLATDPIDPRFPEDFDDFLKYDIAAYLAQKDQRTDDQATMRANQNAMLQQIIEWTRQQTYSLIQRFPQVNPPLTSANAGRAQPLKGQA